MMDLSLDMIVEQQQRVSPTLIAVNQILALSSQELQTAIKQEAEENPAFEVTERHTCSICGEVLKNGVCVHCLRSSPNGVNRSTPSDEIPPSNFRDSDFGGSYSFGANFSDNDEEFDPVSLVASEPTMRERLMYDVRSVLHSTEFAVADYLLGSLDDRGFLASPPDEIARELGVSEERVAKVLRTLQRLGPPGIGAQDHQECLLLQLDYLKQETGEEPPHVREILRDHFTELGEHKFSQIARKLGISAEDVDAARDFIRTHLTPYPVVDLENGAASWGSPSKAQYVSPDVIIKEVEGQLEVEVVESRRFFMRLNPLYSQMAGELRTKGAGISEEDRKHIQQYVSRAKLFMYNVNQRRETMGKIARTLVEHQEDFLRQGVRHLKPLTRAHVAEATGLHESTVSRATAGKFVMLPNRQVVPFSDFFKASLSVKDVISEIVTREGKPMTDREIVNRLRDQGIRVARRTVAKYRSQMGILPSKLR
jgi:RNA polymerase sigma-54 factor